MLHRLQVQREAKPTVQPYAFEIGCRSMLVMQLTVCSDTALPRYFTGAHQLNYSYTTQPISSIIHILRSSIISMCFRAVQLETTVITFKITARHHASPSAHPMIVHVLRPDYFIVLLYSTL